MSDFAVAILFSLEKYKIGCILVNIKLLYEWWNINLISQIKPAQCFTKINFFFIRQLCIYYGYLCDL